MLNWIYPCTLTVQKFKLINRWKQSSIICGLRQPEKWAGLQDKNFWELICYKLSDWGQTISQLMSFYSHCSRISPFQWNLKWNSAHIKPVYNGKLLEDLEIHPDWYTKVKMNSQHFPLTNGNFWESFHSERFFPPWSLFFVGSRYCYSLFGRLSLCFF